MARAQSQQSLTSFLLQGFLPEEIFDRLHQHLLRPNSPFQVLKRRAESLLQNLTDSLAPLVQPFFDAAMRFLADSPELVGLAVFIAVLAVVVVVLNWVRRVVLWWARLTMRVATVALAVALASIIYQRGVYATVRDTVVVGGKVLGFLAAVKDVFWSEYQRYDAQERAAQGRVRQQTTTAARRGNR